MQTNDSPDSQQVSNAPAAKSSVTISDSKIAWLALVVAGISLMGMFRAMDKADAANDRAARAETRADLAQLEVESFKNVLHAAKLPTAAHLPGESP